MSTATTNDKRISFYTLGCKLNYAETITYGRSFIENGFRIVHFKEQTDIVLINTCSVTENADRECRKIVRQALRRSPDAYVIVVGCYAQLQPQEIASIEGVDLVLGASEKFHLFDYVNGFTKKHTPSVHVSCIDDANDFGPAYSDEAGERTRAFLKVQDGCDYTCSFCTIPLARGASRSQSIAATVEQAKKIISEGFHEIVLSGVNVGDFGKKNDESLYELLLALLRIDGKFRIRISSIEPNLLTDEIIELAASSEKMCKHFHIPLQSANNEVLKLMRRRYGLDLYHERIEKIKSLLPDACIGLDVIVGFPGETEERFVDAYTFLVDLPFSYLHVFSYSERENTHALTLNSIVPHRERARRSEMLRNLSVGKRRLFYESQLGKTREVIFEEKSGDGLIVGFTDNYVRVGVRASEQIINCVVPVRLSEMKAGILTAVMI